MTSAAGRKNPLTTPPPPLNTLTAPSFWVTPKGRNYIGIAATACAGVYFGGYSLLHSWLLNRYKNTVQLHKYGFPTPLTPEVMERCQEAKQDLNLKLKNDNIAQFFCVFGMDPFHAGSTKLRSGAIIGVPRSFTYRTASDIEKNDIMVENKNVEWGSDGGMMLQESLLLSERAQKFAIARELVMTDCHYPYIYGSIGAGAIMNYCLVTRFINEKFHGLARPKSFRACVYTFVGTFTLGVWAAITDSITKYYENYADSKAGRVSLDYAKGGVEFYSKVLTRNMALRYLMGPSGEKTFTFYGNNVELIRQKHIPYSERKQKLENIAAELSEISHSTTETKESNFE